jgi:hypothetical protein
VSIAQKKTDGRIGTCRKNKHINHVKSPLQNYTLGPSCAALLVLSHKRSDFKTCVWYEVCMILCAGFIWNVFQPKKNSATRCNKFTRMLVFTENASIFPILIRLYCIRTSVCFLWGFEYCLDEAVLYSRINHIRWQRKRKLEDMDQWRNLCNC